LSTEKNYPFFPGFSLTIECPRITEENVGVVQQKPMAPMVNETPQVFKEKVRRILVYQWQRITEIYLLSSEGDLLDTMELL
jgi:hypothetical protein